MVSDQTIKPLDMMCYGEPAKRRASYDWLRECPAAYGRGAINDASAPCRRVMQDNSDVAPYRAGIIVS